MHMNLKGFRLSRHLSQKKMVSILYQNGFKCSQPFYSLVEGKKRKAPQEMIIAFKRAFPFTLVDRVFYTPAIATKKNASQLVGEGEHDIVQLTFDVGVKGIERDTRKPDEKDNL